MPTTITKAQKTVLELMKLSSFNKFDGEEVVNDLQKHKTKWTGVIWGRFANCPLIILRDIADGYYSGDTMYLSCPAKYVSDVRKLASKWRADEVGYYCDGELEEPYDGILEALVRDDEDNDGFSPLGAPPSPKTAYFRIWWD